MIYKYTYTEERQVECTFVITAIYFFCHVYIETKG